MQTAEAAHCEGASRAVVKGDVATAIVISGESGIRSNGPLTH